MTTWPTSSPEPGRSHPLRPTPSRTPRRGPSRPGFTLVELLVVVAMIMVLAALLMPALKGARERAKAIYCQNNLREIYRAFVVYAATYDDAMPTTFYWDYQLGTGAKCWGVKQDFCGYLQGVRICSRGRWPVMRCPSEPGSQLNSTNLPYSRMNGVAYYNNEMAVMSYTVNWYISMYCYYPGYCPCHDWNNCDPVSYPFRKGFSTGPENCRPSEALLVTDCREMGYGWVYPYTYADIDTDPYYADSWSYAFRHPGRRANIVYMDGHVAAAQHHIVTGTNLMIAAWNHPPP